jgi:hypothetical protein
MMKLQAEAEELFAEACAARGLRAERIPRCSTPRPDFRVILAGGEFVAEVKCPGIGDNIKESMGQRSGVIWSKPGRSVRRLIKDAEGQLLPFATGVPTVVVICDLRHRMPGFPLYPLHGFSDADVAAGMFGETQYVNSAAMTWYRLVRGLAGTGRCDRMCTGISAP